MARTQSRTKVKQVAGKGKPKRTVARVPGRSAELAAVQQELAQERDKLQAILASIADEIWFCDAQGNARPLNAAAVQGLGFDRAAETPLSDLVADLEILKPDGTPRTMEENPIFVPLRGEVCRGEEIIRHRKTGELRYRRFAASPVRDEQGQVAAAVSVVRDVTDLKRAEQALRASEEKYRLLFREGAIPAALTKLPENTFADVNQAFEKLFGYTKAEVVGKTSLELGIIQPEEHAVTVAEVQQHGLHHDVEKHFRTKSGEARILLMNVTALGWMGQRYALTTMQDITERKRAEEALRASEDRFRNMAEFSPAMIVIARISDGTLLFTNPTFDRAFGFREGELMGRKAPDLYADPRDREELMRLLHVNGSVQGHEVQVKKKDGTLFWISASTRIIDFGGERVSLGAFIDITERKKAEEALRESERNLCRAQELLEAVTIGADVIIAAQDTNLRYTYFNQAYQHEIKRLTGKDLALGMSLADLFADLPEQQTIAVREWTKILAGESANDTIEFGDPGRHRRTYHRVHTPLRDAEGRIVGAGEIALDITRLVQTEDALRESEERFRAICEHGPIGIAMGDLDGRVTFANPAFCRMLGYKDGELVGVNFRQLTADQDLLAENRLVEEMLAGKREHYSTEKRYIQKDGQTIWVALAGTVLRHADGTPAFGLAMVHDITERKRVEQALAQSESRFRALFQNLPYLTAVFQKRGSELVLSDYNEAATAMTRGSIQQLVGKTAREIYSSRPEIATHLERAFAEQTVFQLAAPYRLVTTGEDKYTISTFVYVPPDYVMLHVEDITERKRAEEQLRASEEQYRSLFTTMQEGMFLAEVIRDETGKAVDFRYLDANPALESHTGLKPEAIIGRTLQEVLPGVEDPWLETYGRVALTGEPAHVEQFAPAMGRYYTSAIYSPCRGQAAVIFSDITERKKAEAEREKLNQDLERRAVELAAVNKELENFTYAIAHDLRGPLNQVDQLARLVLEEQGTQLTEAGQRSLQLIRENAVTVNRLAEDVLTLARLTQQSPVKQTVPMNELVIQVLEQLTPTTSPGAPRVFAGKPVDIKVGDLPPVEADPAWIRQVWEHLIANALKFTRTRALPCIEIGALEEPGQTVYSVSDNGVGFNMAHADRLFRAFQRLHHAEEFEGNGLGLAIVERIIRCHGGRVWAEARVDQGATFYFTLRPR